MNISDLDLYSSCMSCAPTEGRLCQRDWYDQGECAVGRRLHPGHGPQDLPGQDRVGMHWLVCVDHVLATHSVTSNVPVMRKGPSQNFAEADRNEHKFHAQPPSLTLEMNKSLHFRLHSDQWVYKTIWICISLNWPPQTNVLLFAGLQWTFSTVPTRSVQEHCWVNPLRL